MTTPPDSLEPPRNEHPAWHWSDPETMVVDAAYADYHKRRADEAERALVVARTVWSIHDRKIVEAERDAARELLRWMQANLRSATYVEIEDRIAALLGEKR